MKNTRLQVSKTPIMSWNNPETRSTALFKVEKVHFRADESIHYLKSTFFVWTRVIPNTNSNSVQGCTASTGWWKKTAVTFSKLSYVRAVKLCHVVHIVTNRQIQGFCLFIYRRLDIKDSVTVIIMFWLFFTVWINSQFSTKNLKTKIIGHTTQNQHYLQI